MNITLKPALKVAIPCLGMALYSGLAYGNSCAIAKAANPIFDPINLTLSLPAVKIGEGDFVSAELQLVENTLGWHSTIIQLDNLGDCGWDNAYTGFFDLTTLGLSVQNVQLANTLQAVEASFQWDGSVLHLTSVGESERRFASHIFSDSTQEPIVGAVVTIDGVDAEELTDQYGYFEVISIGNERCLTMTVNASSFAPIAIAVDTIDSGKIQPCN